MSTSEINDKLSSRLKKYITKGNPDEIWKLVKDGKISIDLGGQILIQSLKSYSEDKRARWIKDNLWGKFEEFDIFIRLIEQYRKNIPKLPLRKKLLKKSTKFIGNLFGNYD